MLKGTWKNLFVLLLASGFASNAIAESCYKCSSPANDCPNYGPSSSAYPQFGVAPGFYLGVMAGYATNNGDDQQATILNDPNFKTTLATPRKKQFGSRLFLGYKMNYIASIELGVTYFSKIDYDTKGVQTCTGASNRIRDIELLGKAEVGFLQFNLFGKAGVAVVYQTPSGAFNPPQPVPGSNPPYIAPGTCGKSEYTTKWAPVVSVGVSYTLNQTWVFDVSATRIQTGGIAKSVDFYALGLSYHFVDVYCGQFLC